MTGIFIINEETVSEIVTPNVFGCDFKVSVFNQEDNTYIAEDLSTEELVEPVDDFSTTITNNQSINDDVIELDTVDGLSSTDRIQLGNYIYLIINIIDNNIYINGGLKENLTSGDSATRVGNLAVYKIKLTFDTLGDYTLIAKDSIYGLAKTQMISVKPKSIETMYKDIKNLEYAILGS